jgi:acetyltransferase
MIRGGKEVIFGVTRDPEFGPVLLFGLGGIYVEVIRDVSVRVHPITDIDADEMIRATKGYRLLEGVRGEPPVDRELLRETLLRLSQLVADFDVIREMDINPFISAPRGATSAVVDARISIDG